MRDEIAARQRDLAALRKQFHVQRLELFGSATSPEFDPKASDLDFLVEFESLPVSTYADTFFGLLEALEKLFGRNVDLVVDSAVTNPYFRQSIEHGKTLLYAG